MKRYIDGTALLNKYNSGNMTANEMYQALIEQPTADVVEVKHGTWISHYDDLFPVESTQECSICHEEESISLYNENYCPNCGAKMDGGDSE